MNKEKVIVDTDSEKVTIGIDEVTFALVHYRKNIFRNEVTVLTFKEAGEIAKYIREELEDLCKNIASC